MLGIGALLSTVAGLGASASGLSALPLVGGLISFFGSRGGRLFGVGLIALVIFGYGYARGERHADARCRAATLQARLDQVTVERDSANARLARSALVIAALERAKSGADEELAKLAAELDRLKPQSTALGAKHDPNALVDDKCRLTPRGARR
jgi:hypothetical protein